MYRLLVACISLAAKTYDDNYYTGNNSFRSIVCLEKSSMRHMERKLLSYLDFNIIIDQDDYNKYVEDI